MCFSLSSYVSEFLVRSYNRSFNAFAANLTKTERDKLASKLNFSVLILRILLFIVIYMKMVYFSPFSLHRF